MRGCRPFATTGNTLKRDVSYPMDHPCPRCGVESLITLTRFCAGRSQGRYPSSSREGARSHLAALVARPRRRGDRIALQFAAVDGSLVGTFETCRTALNISGYRGKPEAPIDAATRGTVSWSHVGYPINETKSRAQCRRSAQELRQSRKKKCPTSLRRRNRYVHRANTLPRPLSSDDTPPTPQTASTSPIRLRISSRSS